MNKASYQVLDVCDGVMYMVSFLFYEARFNPYSGSLYLFRSANRYGHGIDAVMRDHECEPRQRVL